MPKKYSVPRGTADILPTESADWQDIEHAARHIFHLYGYQEIRTPYFEETELFARSMGQNSDVVQKQMLTLQSQRANGAEKSEYALRPEGTASVVRSYIQHGLDKKYPLSKLFYFGPMFRGERPQRGRLRQFHQIGAEAIGPGSASPYLDAEVIALSVQMLHSFGLQNFQLKINTLGSADDKEVFSKLLRKALKPHSGDLCEDCQERFQRNVFRILDCKNKSCRAIVVELNLGYEYLSKESLQYFEEVKKALSSLKVAFQQSESLVRGLDYYTHTVFEISDSSLGSQDALGAGGRYSTLFRQLGGPEVDAIGFALGIERILLAKPRVDAHDARLVDIFIVVLEPGFLPNGFELLHALRSEGISSDMGYRLSSVKSQMRIANKSGAKLVILLGEEEMKKGVVTLKDMESGGQEHVAVRKDFSPLIDILKERCAEPC